LDTRVSAAVPADCTVWVIAGPTGAGTCEVTEVTALTTVSTGVGRGEGPGPGLGDGVGEEETGAGRGGGAEPDVGGPPVIGRIVTPPGAIVPPVEARPVDATPDPGLGAVPGGATRVRAPREPGRLATVRVTRITGMAAPDVRAVTPPGLSGPALSAGGPENTWPSTPSWLKPPPRARATSAAIIADGTISAALEAANS
jgi:hypothetical protein